MTDITNELEVLIDRHGLTHVVTVLSLICSEKAVHLRRAEAWNADAKTLEKAARMICSDS